MRIVRLSVAAALLTFSALALASGCSTQGKQGASRVDVGLGDSSPTKDAGSPDTLDAETRRGVPAPGAIVSEETCTNTGTLAGAECKRLIVRCPGVANLGVTLRYARPTAPVRATMIVGSGGAGNAFIEEAPLALALERELLASGYLVVSRRWDDPGWFGGSGGMRASSCRYGALLRWVDENVRAPNSPYCALGLSGGSYEIGYALARWDGADRLAGAVMLAGPAVSRLDSVCPSVATASWTDGGCRAVAEKYSLPCTGTLTCTLQGAAAAVDSAWTPDAPCTDPADSRVAELADDGVVTESSRFDYPDTKVRFVLGADECGAAALLYYDRILSPRAMAFAEGTPHDVLSTDAGLAATKRAIAEACVPPP